MLDFYILENCFLTIILAGIIGNLLVICVYNRQCFQNYSYSFLCQMKSFIDTFILLCCWQNWTKLAFNIDFLYNNVLICVFLSDYFLYVLIIASSWILVFITMDRLVSTVYPSRFCYLRTRWFQLIFICFTFIYGLTSNILVPLNTYLVHVNETNTTTVCLTSPDALARNSWIILGHVVFVIIFLNICLSVKLVWHLNDFKPNLVTVVCHTYRNRKRERKFTICAIGLGLIAFFCKLVFAVGNVLAYNILRFNLDNKLAFIIGIVICGFESGLATFLVNFLLNDQFGKEMRLLFRFRKS